MSARAPQRRAQLQQRAQAAVLRRQTLRQRDALGLLGQLLAHGVFVLQGGSQAAQVVAAAGDHFDRHHQRALRISQQHGQARAQRRHHGQPGVGHHQKQGHRRTEHELGQRRVTLAEERRRRAVEGA